MPFSNFDNTKYGRLVEDSDNRKAAIRDDLQKKKLEELKTQGAIDQNKQDTVNTTELTKNKVTNTTLENINTADNTAQAGSRKSLAGYYDTKSTEQSILNDIGKATSKTAIQAADATHRQISTEKGLEAATNVREGIVAGHSVAQDAITNSPGDFIPGAADRILGKTTPAASVPIPDAQPVIPVKDPPLFEQMQDTNMSLLRNGAVPRPKKVKIATPLTT